MSRILSNVIILLLNTVKHGENVHNKRFIFKNLRYTVFNNGMFTSLLSLESKTCIRLFSYRKQEEICINALHVPPIATQELQL